MDPVKISRSNGGQQIFSFLSFLSSKMRLPAVSRKSHFKMHRIEMAKYDSNERKLYSLRKRQTNVYDDRNV